MYDFCKKRHVENLHSNRCTQKDIKCMAFVRKEVTENCVSFLTKAIHDFRDSKLCVEKVT